MLNKCPNLLNTQKSDGYSALHLASTNGHEKVVTVLLQEVRVRLCLCPYAFFYQYTYVLPESSSVVNPPTSNDHLYPKYFLVTCDFISSTRYNHQGPVVQSPISTNPGLTLNRTYRVNPGLALIEL